jgi:hypothetical protein
MSLDALAKVLNVRSSVFWCLAGGLCAAIAIPTVNKRVQLQEERLELLQQRNQLLQQLQG